MIEVQELVERSSFAALTAPETAPADRDARLEQVSRVFSAFAHVLEPLALEVERCFRELDVGLPSRAWSPNPACGILTLRELPPDVVVVPTIAAPPPATVVDAIDRDAIAALLRGDAPDANVLLDWCSIRTLAVSVYTPRPLDALHLRPHGRTVHAHAPGWFAGPVGAVGFDRNPPAELALRCEARVTATVEIAWSGWRFDGSLERQAFESACAALVRAGWSREY
ncbi:hypothetical protein L6R52_08755 [Myxococcota bacterium]|nr:hypothetical protein [Myxococcota bacterium]